MNKPTFVMIMGAPMTGRHGVAEALSRSMGGCEIVSTQRVRAEMFPGEGFDPTQDPWLFEECNRRVCLALENGQSIILVGGNRKSEHRRKLVSVAKKHGCVARCVYCARSLKSVLKANRTAGEKIPPDELERRFRMMPSPPSYEEGWDAIYKGNVDNRNCYLKDRR